MRFPGLSSCLEDGLRIQKLFPKRRSSLFEFTSLDTTRLNSHVFSTGSERELAFLLLDFLEPIESQVVLDCINRGQPVVLHKEI